MTLEKRYSKRGFTIMELMVAMIAFSVMVLTVGIILVFSWKSWVNYRDQLAMQRDASLAMLMISKEIRNATYDDITDGTSISFAGSGFSFTPSGNDLLRSDGMKVVDGWLSENSFISRKLQDQDEKGETNNWVQVSFTLETSTDTENYSIEVMPRN